MVTSDGGRHEQQGRDEEGQHARRGAAGESVAVVAEAKDHGAEPDAGATATKSAPKRSRTQGEAGQREQPVRVCTVGRVAGGEHVGRHPNPQTQAAMVSATDSWRPRSARGASAPTTGGQAEQGRGHEQSDLTSRPGPATRR